MSGRTRLAVACAVALVLFPAIAGAQPAQVEMRNFLNVLQIISDAVTREDMTAVAEAARSMGSGAANQIPPQTVAKLPETFQMLAGTVHTSFDFMALDADSLGDPMHTQRQLARMMQTCNACHGIYQVAVETEPFPPLKR